MNQFDKTDFLVPASNESIALFLDRDPFFSWVKCNLSPLLSGAIITGLYSNLVHLGQSGLTYLQEICSNIDNAFKNELASKYQSYSEKEISAPFSYEHLQQLGYLGPMLPLSPIESALLAQKEVMLKNRGLKRDPKGKITINANIFAEYLLKRMHLVSANSALYIYTKAGLFEQITDSNLKKLCREILHEAESNIWNRQWEKEYYDALKLEMPHIPQLNPNKALVNLQNGMLDLYTLQFEAHSPEFLSTIQVPILYNPLAMCPRFEAFLWDIFEGDSERVQLIQELLGYCFLPENKIQKAFLFLGSGSNGKSVLAEVIRSLIGVQNTGNVPLDKLSDRFGMQNLPGKLVNISTETEFSKKFNTQNFKLLTGGDAVNVEQKYKDSFNTTLYAKIIILVNRLMDTDDYSNGYYRRLQIIPFNRVYKEKNADSIEKTGTAYMDKDLTTKLKDELSGILNFAMEGLQRLIENNFNLTYSQICETALVEYQKRQNPVKDFYKDRVIASQEATSPRADFRRAFSQWASSNGYEDAANMGSTRFWDLFRNILAENHVLIREKKIQGTVWLEGLSLRDSSSFLERTPNDLIN